MRVCILGLTALLLVLANTSFAQSPPFVQLMISGKASDMFDKVSLFEGGSSNTPLKTEDVSEYDGHVNGRLKVSHFRS